MPEKNDCAQARDTAEAETRAAVEALQIDVERAPLLKEVSGWEAPNLEGDIGREVKAQIEEAYVQKMRDVTRAVDALRAAAASPKQAKTLEEVLKEAEQATAKALAAARDLEAAKKALESGKK